MINEQSYPPLDLNLMPALTHYPSDSLQSAVLLFPLPVLALVSGKRSVSSRFQSVLKLDAAGATTAGVLRAAKNGVSRRTTRVAKTAPGRPASPTIRSADAGAQHLNPAPPCPDTSRALQSAEPPRSTSVLSLVAGDGSVFSRCQARSEGEHGRRSHDRRTTRKRKGR